jgi:hypothetical protein
MPARPPPEVASEAWGWAMSRDTFNLIDRQKLLSGAADYGAGQVSAPPGLEANPVGLVLDARIGRHRVRFLGVIPAGESPQFLTIWTPAQPKRLKPALVKKYRRERRNFVTAVARQFGLAFQIIDRMSGAPRTTELVYADGEVEPVEPPAPYPEALVH